MAEYFYKTQEIAIRNIYTHIIALLCAGSRVRGIFQGCRVELK